MFIKFLHEKRVNEWHSLSSLRGYESLFRHLENYKPEYTLSSLINFLAKASIDRKWSDATYNFYVKKLRAFLVWTHREWYTENIAPYIIYKKQDKLLPRCIPLDDIRWIISKLTEEDARVIRILLHTGLRRFELANLERKHINLERKEIIVFGKWRKERIVPIHPNIMDDIQQVQLPIWLLGIDRIRRRVQVIYPRFTLHRLRHTFATELIRADGNLYVVSQILWHGHIDTTAIYLSLDSTSSQKEIKKFNF